MSTSSPQGRPFAGLCLAIDELENIRLLHRRQERSAVEAIRALYAGRRSLGPFLACFGLTPAGESYLRAWWPELGPVLDDGLRVGAPPLTRDLAWELARRIRAVHGAAFGWEPGPDAAEIAGRAWRAARAEPAGRWRSFVQRAVQLLETEHQRQAGAGRRPQSGPDPPAHQPWVSG